MNEPTIENPWLLRDYRPRFRPGRGIVHEFTVWLAFPRANRDAAMREYRDSFGEWPPYDRALGKFRLLGPIEREET